MAHEFNDGYGVGFDHGFADGRAFEVEAANVSGLRVQEQARQEEREVCRPRIEFAEGWRYGALFAQANSELGIPEMVDTSPAYAAGWRAGFTWYRAVTKDLVLPS